jgi:LacI family transcriptional regulator
VNDTKEAPMDHVKGRAPRVTIRDVAIEAGFSINTVSRALNDKAEIHPATKEKILAAAAKLGYRANRLAKGLRSNKTGTVGVVVTDVANPFFSALVKAMAQAARESEYSIILQDSNENDAGEEEAIRVLLAEQVDGILITPVQRREETIARLCQTHVPFVLVGRYFAGLDTNYIVPDDYLGGFMATEHLLHQGYRKIAMVNGPLHISSARERLQGFTDALARYGLSPDPSRIVTGALTVGDGFDLARSILRKPPEAIVSYSDFVAFGVMQAVREIGLSIPEGVAVVGFDDVRMASCLQVPLTTIRSPKEELGRQAVKLLVKQLQGTRGNDEKEKRKLPVTLVIRDSSQKRANRNRSTQEVVAPETHRA